MLRFLRFTFSNDLDSHLNETKKVKIAGVKFVIKKLNTLNYLDGSKSLRQVYDLYKTKGQESADPASEKKLAEHFSHVLVNCVVSPKLSLKDDGSGYLVDKMFSDWDMVVNLYNEIMVFTYGKKKMKQSL